MRCTNDVLAHELLHRAKHRPHKCSILGRKERKDYICSSRLGLIRWYDRFRSDRRIQQVKAILDKVRYTNDNLLPHKLLHGASAIHKQSSILVPHNAY